MIQLRPYMLSIGLACGLMSGVAHAAAQPISYPSCQKTLTYKILFNGASIGQYQRQENWNGQSATIRSHGKISLFITSASINQQSDLTWSAKENQFINTAFNRQITGLMSGKTQTTYSNNGHTATNVSDGKTQQFSTNDLPILNTDSIGEQIRFDIMHGKKNFDFNMISDNKLKHYYFTVAGNEMLETNYGRINTIKVTQIRAKDRQLILWFAPSLDYQMVKGQYERSVIDVKAILENMRSTCPSESQI